ncbi:MAG: hypothetical protein IT293_18350 [Deltaproteobacteria bacterium]|nr:hypothetical protein [Deltaproteobacteria bacterium]
MDAGDMRLDRRDFFRTLAAAGVAASALGLAPAAAEAAGCPKLPKAKKSKDVVPVRIESEVGDLIDGAMDLRTVAVTPKGVQPVMLSVELLLDTFALGKDVRELTGKMEQLALVNQELHRPPTCLLTWGTGGAFKCILEESGTGFTLFLDDGTPCRSVMRTRFQILPDECAPFGTGTP